MDIETAREYCLAKKAVTECLPFDEYSLVMKVNTRRTEDIPLRLFWRDSIRGRFLYPYFLFLISINLRVSGYEICLNFTKSHPRNTRAIAIISVVPFFSCTFGQATYCANCIPASSSNFSTSASLASRGQYFTSMA